MVVAEPVPDAVDWSQDEYWQKRRLSPGQILIHDVKLAQKPWATDDNQAGPWVEHYETLSSGLLKDLETRDKLEDTIDCESLSTNKQEQTRLKNLAHQYGWLNTLRSKGVQQNIDDAPGFRKCRWIHISSKFTEYLQGCLFALSDWNSHPDAGRAIVASLRHMTQCMQQNERFSKHGRYFAPFLEPLSDSKVGGPVLMSVPFLDWSVDGEPPPLRFQVDPREGFQSTRNSAHMLRSILQHYYRLEDTSERESQQVFSKYRPWMTDRYLDLKIRRWYGQYPASLNVDELWILVIDSRHIVTFSSNQSWKSRWPPLQFASRVAEISFRSIRDELYRGPEGNTEYTAYTHSVACLSGALGLLHRSFWTDLPLCIVDRYAGYLSHLQYRLLRSPSTKLVMDLLQVQEELNIIIQVMQQQLELVECVQTEWNAEGIELLSIPRSRASSAAARPRSLGPRVHYPAGRNTYKRYDASFVSDPMTQLLESLRREFDDLCELRDNSNTLVNRTIQLVNIRLEDHGKAILVFTVVTLIFLPLSFVSSYFGMNTSDIRNMDGTQKLFWTVSASVTIAVVGIAVFIAFYGSQIVETVSLLTNQFAYSRAKKGSAKALLPRRPSGFTNFEVIGTSSF
jgi:hypothetical protein